MYSNNDYRYYLERRMVASNDILAHYAMVSYDSYLAHHGVPGMRWGHRKERYVARMASNNAKIQRYTTKLNTVGAQKRKAKAAKYQAKVDKLQRKASKAQKRLAQGKSLSGGQQKKLMRYEQYKAKVAKNSYKNDKFQAKINKLQTKNARIQRRIVRGDYRNNVAGVKSMYSQAKKQAPLAKKNLAAAEKKQLRDLKQEYKKQRKLYK